MTRELSPIDGLHIEHHDAVLRVRLDRTHRSNAMTDTMVDALTKAVETAGDDESVRVVEITAEGDNFCSGFDLSERGAPSDDSHPRVGSTQRRMRTESNRLVTAILETQTPVVVGARGWAVGLGLSLVLAADFAVVADDARLRAPFTPMGFTPDSGASWLLPRLVGLARAKDLLLLGRTLTGEDAARWGLVHASAPKDEVEARSCDLVDELAAAPTVAIGLAKRLILTSLDHDLAHQMASEALSMEVSLRSEDAREGRRARRERRDPHYRGR